MTGRAIDTPREANETMLKTSILMTRKDGMSVEEFQQYWKESHGPLAADVPGLRRYIQCHTIREDYDGPPEYDGVAELWWDDVAAFEQAAQTPEFQAVLADTQHFVGESMVLLANEVALVDDYPSPAEREGMVKYIAMLMLKDGVSITDFQHHWQHVHGPINVENIAGMKRYVQSHILPAMFEGPNPPPFGGLPEAWFDSVEDMRNRPRNPNARRDEDWDKFCSGQKAIFTREVVILE